MGKIAKEYRRAPAIRELALFLVQHLPPKDWSGEARAIHNYVRDQIRYVKDIAGCETIQTPIQTLKIRQGDCDDKSTLVASLLGAIGHPVRFVAVGMEKDNYSHVFPQTKIGGRWITLETTENWPMGRTAKNVRSQMVEHV
jgi:transglutaminase-like putative cysteine protease